MIPNFALTSSALPNLAPLGGALEVSITPAASGSSETILAGSSIGGSSVVFSDLHGLAAYKATGGWDTRGARHGQINRLLRGNEDDTWRKT